MMTKVKILCLHRITDKKYPCWPGMPLSTFEKLLNYVSRHYYVCLPDDVKPDLKKKQLILTFDDGFDDFYLNAFPLLKKYKLPAVLNVVVKCVTDDYQIWTQRLNDTLDAYAISKKSFEIKIKDTVYSFNINAENAEKIAFTVYKLLLPVEQEYRDLLLSKLETETPGKIDKTLMMNVSQLKEVSEHRIIIGSHTMTHPNLQLKASEAQTLEYEIVASKMQLEKLLGLPVEVFAFPNGMYSEASIEIAVKSGYKYLLLVDNQIAQYNHSDAMKLLDRILIYSEKHWKNIFRILNFHNILKH